MLAAGARVGWLLDTNVISEGRKGSRGNAAVVRWLAAVSPEACFLSAVSLAELRLGAGRVSDAVFRAELEKWVEQEVRAWFGVRTLPVDDAVLLTWRRLVIAGQKARYTYSPPDALIAATALVHGLTVVTRNTVDFTRAEVMLFDPWTG